MQLIEREEEEEEEEEYAANLLGNMAHMCL